MPELTQARLKALVRYEPETGVFTWISARGRGKSGEVAGTLLADGYTRIQLDRRQYLAHRLAVLYTTGELPPDDMDVDHINGNRGDNRFSNLRIVLPAVNRQNMRKAKANNKTGLLGVSQDGKRFRAHIWVDGANRHLGTFSTAEEAHAAYLIAKRQLHAGCTI